MVAQGRAGLLCPPLPSLWDTPKMSPSSFLQVVLEVHGAPCALTLVDLPGDSWWKLFLPQTTVQ